jgi:hypothetical protein
MDALERTGLPSPSTEFAPPEPTSFVEAARLQTAVREELDAILTSPSFRTSRRSCEFLSYVVQVALDGRIDSLKERSIGLDLLGRDISYDPSSDATVRVRANEVRKRLRSFYATQPSKGGYRIELLPGSYGPRFVRDPYPLETLEAIHLDPPPELEKRVVLKQLDLPPLNLIGIMWPAFVALFICTLFLRQQIQSGDPYHQFWDKRLQGKEVMVLAGDKAPDQAALFPLIWLAGRYDLKSLVNPQKTESEDKQAGPGAGAITIHSTQASPPEFAADKRLGYIISGSPGSLRLIDRLGPTQKVSATEHAAVLTVFPEQPGSLWIAGTDWESISRLSEMIATKSSFPRQLDEQTKAGDVVQVVYRGGSSPRLELYAHQP